MNRNQKSDSPRRRQQIMWLGVNTAGQFSQRRNGRQVGGRTNLLFIIPYSIIVITTLAALIGTSASLKGEPGNTTRQLIMNSNDNNSGSGSTRQGKQLDGQDLTGFQLHDLYTMGLEQQQQQLEQQQRRNLASTAEPSTPTSGTAAATRSSSNATSGVPPSSPFECPNGLLTFELSTGFIYKPAASDETLSMMPSTLQLTDCLDYCLHNASCQAINFEMGLCVLLATSATQNPQNLHSSQFPVFTIYAEKKCLLTEPGQAKHRRRCQRAWTFERVAGYEMKLKPRRRVKLATKELCMDACLVEREFACRSANWYRQTGECSLSDQDRHSLSQSEAGDQHLKASLINFYGPQNASEQLLLQQRLGSQQHVLSPSASSIQGFHRHHAMANNNNNHNNNNLMDRSRLSGQPESAASGKQPPTSGAMPLANRRLAAPFRQLFYKAQSAALNAERQARQVAAAGANDWHHYADAPAGSAAVDYLENNCIYEPNKLCEFRKIQNKVLKTVDSIYQDVATLDECRQKCLNAPYRCYSFDYGDTSERVCRTSHLDQASLLSVNEPYLEVVGAITYELATCFNVSIQCRAKGMVAMVSSSKSFNGKIYAKSRPTSCVNDVTNSLQFELSMKYHDDLCDVRASSNQQRGVFSNDIVIQHHDRIVTTQDVGLSVYCQYDLGNRSVTNNVDLAIERLPDESMESKQQVGVGGQSSGGQSSSSSSSSSGGPLAITGLATTVVRSPNVTMRITNMNGQPVTSATVGDRLALLFEIKEKTSPFGIIVREILAMDGRQLATTSGSQLNNSQIYHHYASDTMDQSLGAFNASGSANSIQFLDSDGCPTDANLMGPLVKMDPQGHRLLAPFDAFKFPASEMVFFRAVVSSCVAECKPAACAAPVLIGGGAGGGGVSLPNLSQPEQVAASGGAPPTYGDLFSPTPPDDVVATTRNMPTTQHHHPIPSDASTGRPSHVALATSTATSSTATSTTVSPPSPSSAATAYTMTPTTQSYTYSQPPLRSSSTLAPYEPSRTTKLHDQLEHQQHGVAQNNQHDLLTTVAGFNSFNQNGDSQQQQQQQMQMQSSGSQDSSIVIATTSTTSRPVDPATHPVTTTTISVASVAPSNEFANSQATDQSLPFINMTNNHNLGRPTPRPMTSTTTAIQFDIGDQMRENLQAQQQLSSISGQLDQHRPSANLPLLPAKLDPLTAQERQAILDLLSGHEKSNLLSSSSSSPSAATGQQASLMDEQLITKGLMKLYPILELFRQGGSKARELASGATGNQTSHSVLQEIKALITDQFHESERNKGEQVDRFANETGQSPTTTIAQQQQQQNKTKRSSSASPQVFGQIPSQEFVELINKTLIDYIIAEELRSALLTQMLVDEARETLTTTDLPRNNKEARKLVDDDIDVDAEKELAQQRFPLDLLQRFFNALDWPPLSGSIDRTRAPTFEQTGKLVKAKFDQELASKIQRIVELLDDGKTVAKVKHRAKRAADSSRDELIGYAHASQPQHSRLEDLAQNGLRFTRGHVEMYHMSQLHRLKRHTADIPFEEFEAHLPPGTRHDADSQQPKYEMEEMIVQSIKIVDRLQFEDEATKHPTRFAQNASSTNRETKSTAVSKRPPRKHSRTVERPMANRQLGVDSGQADESSERLPDEGQPIKSRLSAINILLVAMCFIFVQISVVLLCFINWNSQRQRYNRRSLFADLTPFKTVDRSTISSSMTYSDCSNHR